MSRTKMLIPILLLALLIVLMSSGSFAVYTQTQTLSGQLYTRIFLFMGTEKTTNYEFGLSGLALAPGDGEKELYRFTITNSQTGGSVCDYSMLVSIASSGMANAISSMSGLTFYLYDMSVEGSGPVATITSGELSLGGISFIAEVSKTVEYRLTANWADNGDMAAQTAVALSGQQFPIQITITAEGTN